LLEPIVKDLEQARAQTILWSLDDTLRYLPIAALHDGRGYLVERFRHVVYTPAGRASLTDAPRPNWTGLGAGVSRGTAGFAPLPAVVEELQGIFRRTPDGGTGVLDGRVLLDDAFTADALRENLRQPAPVVHIASHFQLNPGDVNQSFLLLGDGSRMTLAEFRTTTNIFQDVDLLTLSACSTAVGSRRADGSEVENLGVLAQRQGAKAVIAGLWPVADVSTSTFMREFYRAKVQNGTDKSEALRQAQLALLHGAETPSPKASGPPPPSRGLKTASTTTVLPPFTAPPNARYAHPYFWAPFVLMGNSR
jgi:CHAT domain-containing protein